MATGSRRSFLVVLLRVSLVVWLAIGLLLFLLQRQLIYHPGPASSHTPAAFGWHYEDLSLRATDGTVLHAWWIPHPDLPADAPTILCLHGNAGTIADRLGLVRHYRTAGCHCLLLDWRGYGESEGTPCESGLYQDAQAAWKHLTDRGVPADRIVIHGRSLGGGPATWLARRERPAGLILDSTFTSLADLAGETYPMFPTGLMLLDEYPNLERVRGLACPLLVIHSAGDQLIGLHHGQMLHEAAPDPKHLVVLRGSHASMIDDSGPAYTEALRDFIDGIRRRSAPTGH